jgi:hypothetical protein
MPYRRYAMLALVAGPLAACASGQQLYPQPYIAQGGPVAVTPETMAAFRARTIVTPPHGKVQDLAEAYIASAVPHPSSAKFTGEFESNGKSLALCGFVKYRDNDGSVTDWRPFFVEWTTHHAKGTQAPFDYNADTEVAKLCGPMTPPAE